MKEETDTKEVPPCMILKSDGASLYNTTDLATIMDRMAKYHPDRLIYLTDKRQDLYFEQVFRCARKTKLVNNETELVHIGFGTMNGKDGKPFKTREGGVMRLENLIREINEEMIRKIQENAETKGYEIDMEQAGRRRKSSAWRRLNTAICQIRRLRTIFLIWTGSLPLREIPGLIFSIRLYGSSQFLPSTRNREES